jgi:hypothetical protein
VSDTVTLFSRRRDKGPEAASGFDLWRSAMPNLFKTSILLASLLAASALTIPGARAEPMNGPLMGSTPPHHHSLDSELQRRFLKYQITAPPVTGPSPGIHLDFESLGRIHGHPGGK